MHAPRRRRPRGLTLAELVVTVAVTGVIASAAAALAAAVGQQWSASQQEADAGRLLARGRASLDRSLANAKRVLAATDPDASGARRPAELLVWRADDWGGAADGVPQLAELALYRHEPATGRLLAHVAEPRARMNADEVRKASTPVDANVDALALADLFAREPYVVAAPLLGGADGALVAEAAFGLVALAPGKPAVTYALTVVRADARRVLDGTVVLRAAQ